MTSLSPITSNSALIPVQSMPDGGYRDVFTYTVTDANGLTTTASISVLVRVCAIPLDPPEIFVPDEEIPYVPPVIVIPPRIPYGWGVFIATDDGTNPDNWLLHRQEGERIDTPKLKSALIYDQGTKIDQDIADLNRPVLRRSPTTPRAEGLAKKTPHSISEEPLILDGMHIYDPFWGLIPGVAEKEISYITQYDPASYEENTAWGREHVGELWWDTSKVAYLEAQTDTLYSGSDARLLREIEYRKKNWGKLAPGSRVRIYEWVRSYDQPTSDDPVYEIDGFRDILPVLEFDDKLGRQTYVYYFWLMNNTEVPVNIPNRTLSAERVAQIIANPTGEGITWIAPILPNGLLAANLAPHINNTSSVLQIDVAKNDYEGEVHHDWQLVRALDDRTQAPPALLVQMNHSLTGINDVHRPVPDPAIPVRDRMGASFRPRRSLLAAERADMLAARRSFVELVNVIFARTNFLLENPEAFNRLARSTPTFKNLVWQQPYGTTGIEFPPANAYDFEVASFEERDAVLFSTAYLIASGYRPFEKQHWDVAPWDFDRRITASAKARPARILVTNYESETPSWSIWEVPPDAQQSVDDPSAALVLSHQWDRSYPTYAAMILEADAGLIPEGERCLVEADERYEGFWTIHAYRPSNVEADRSGFIYENAQTYRASDFIEIIDWYATGYTSLKPPITIYPTIEARNLAEMPNPKNTLVRVNDDTSGHWIWTAWDGTNWSTVARQNSSLRLSSAFYDPARVPYGIGNVRPVLDDIDNRDGTLELRQIELALRQSNILTRSQINEVFFSLLHFAHTRQDQVDWAFKTSFLTVVGFNERLEQTPIATYDTTDNLLDYIDEVKPYRVKTREFTRRLTPPVDQASAHITDFDKPLFFDTELGAYRKLDPANPADMAYMADNMPWADWYENFLKSSTDPASPQYNPVRRIRTTLRFDRTDATQPFGSGSGWDLVPFDILAWDGDERTRETGGSALARLLTWYNPGDHMIAATEKDELNGSGFKGTIIDGGAFKQTDTDRDSAIDGNAVAKGVDIDINPNGSSFGLRDPHHAEGHPQELLPILTNSTLSITARTRWVPGGPQQFVTYVDTSRLRKTSVTVSFGQVASSGAALFVYKDGVRLSEDTDYKVDHFARTVLVSLTDKKKPRHIAVHVFGPSATGTIVEQRFYRADGVTGRFPVVKTISGNVDVVVDGKRIPAEQVENESNAIVVVPTPKADADVLLNVCGSVPGTSRATHVHLEVLAYQTPQTWLLGAPTSPLAWPEHGATIVEVNGKRLTPPFTRHGSFTDTNRIILVREVADIANLSVWLDGVLFTDGIKHFVEPVAIDGGNIAPGFKLVLNGQHLYANDASIRAQRVVAVVREDHEVEIEAGSVTIIPELLANARIEATTFQNADLMGIETHSFDGSIGGIYILPGKVIDDAYVSVWMDGLHLVPGLDYTVSDLPAGAFDTSYEEPGLGFGDEAPYTRVTIPGGQRREQRVVITAYTGAPARLPTTWGMMTAKPSMSLMGDYVMQSDLGNPLEEAALGSTVVATAESSRGIRPMYRMNETWEVFPWDDWNGAVLAADLMPEETEIRVTLATSGIHTDLAASNPLSQPDLEEGRPGVVYIDGERIEYFAMEQTGNDVVLTEIRRGSRLTAQGRSAQITKLYGDSHKSLVCPFDGGDIDRPIEVVRYGASGQITGLILQDDFAMTVRDGGLDLTLTRPIAEGETVVILQTGPVKHPAGVPVRNATRSTGAADTCPFRISDIASQVEVDATQSVYRA